MTKILYMIACLRTGGSEAYLLNLVRNLDKDRYQITVWCEGEWGPAGDELRKAGATVIQQRLRPRPREVIRAIRLLRRERFDIVHSLKYGPTYIDPLVCKISRVKVFIGSRRNLPHWVNQMQFTTADRIRNKLTDTSPPTRNTSRISRSIFRMVQFLESLDLMGQVSPP